MSGLDKSEPRRTGLRVAGLFAGIGGIELGLHRAGHRSNLLCELEPTAVAVLEHHFPGVPVVADVCELDRLPDVELVVAGFPCQDLSQAGRTAGIRGRNSGLVGEVFRLVERADSLRWLLLENVPFMLKLARGDAMRHVTASLEELGFRWAYRTVDARAFGIPQRRKRVLLLASRDDDPAPLLFGEDACDPGEPSGEGRACGFYWTEGTRGLGWANDAVPTLKGGSTIGIPSPPAIRLPDGRIVLPDIRDAERLQGFDADWTAPATADGQRHGVRWKLVGNAVSVPVAQWIGERLLTSGAEQEWREERLPRSAPWPSAARGGGGLLHRAEVSGWPVRRPYQHLAEYLEHPTRPLSERATAGFHRRASASSLRFPEGFLDHVAEHLRRQRNEDRIAA